MSERYTYLLLTLFNVRQQVRKAKKKRNQRKMRMERREKKREVIVRKKGRQ